MTLLLENTPLIFSVPSLLNGIPMEPLKIPTCDLHTIRDYIRFAMTCMARSSVYFGHGTDNAFDEAVDLVFFSLGLTKGYEDILLDARLTEEEKVHVLTLIDKRCNGRVPTPYLTGEAQFMGLPFYVNEHVLIPRSPIAELIENRFVPWLTVEPHRVLDLCTGSGCIGIAIAHVFENAEIILADISPEALMVAKRNISRYELEYRTQTVHSDVFEEIEGTFDLIVANPPYVDQEDIDTMPEEYSHEPLLALASGDDGLDITRRILREAVDYLSTDGVLICEVGNSCIALERAFSNVAFTWLEFERGGHGVFVMTKQELEQNQQYFV